MVELDIILNMDKGDIEPENTQNHNDGKCELLEKPVISSLDKTTVIDKTVVSTALKQEKPSLLQQLKSEQDKIKNESPVKPDKMPQKDNSL